MIEMRAVMRNGYHKAPAIGYHSPRALTPSKAVPLTGGADLTFVTGLAARAANTNIKFKSGDRCHS
jgi:hypothetical protein